MAERQLADAADQLAGDAGDRAGLAREARLERVEDVAAVEGAGRRLLAGHELVEVPAQAVLRLGPLGHEVLAMVDEEAHLALGAVEAGDRQVGLAQGRAGDREGVDGIALAGLAADAAGPGHELGRHPHDALARGQQVALEAAREVAAVLQRERPLGPAGCPAADLEVARPGVAATVFSASLRPCSSTATSVCVRLCRSAPMITMSRVSFLSEG